MPYAAIRREDLTWEPRPSEPGEAQRHRAAVTDLAGFEHTRANFWRFEPGAKGRRHRDLVQEETFVVVNGTLTMYLGDPPQRHDVEAGGVVHVKAGTELQIVNHADDDLLVYAYGAPPDHGHAEFLDSAV